MSTALILGGLVVIFMAVIAVLIVQIGKEYDKAIAELIDAYTDEIVEQHRSNK